MNDLITIEFTADKYLKKDADIVVQTLPKSFELFFDLSQKNYQTIHGLLKQGYLYESDVSGFMTRIVHEGDVLVDVGANIGFYSMLLSALTGNSGRVVSFEPGEKNVVAIFENIEINQFKNIDVRKKLVGHLAGMSAYYHFDVKDTGCSYAVEDISESKDSFERKSLCTLDDELTSLAEIKLVKIDVEGFEVNVLKGAFNLLSSNRVRYWIVEYAPQTYALNGYTLETLREYMSQFGLEMFILDYQRGFPKFYPRNLSIGGKWIINLLFAKMGDLELDWIYDDTSRMCSPPQNW